jgi:hypothetical protein
MTMYTDIIKRHRFVHYMRHTYRVCRHARYADMCVYVCEPAIAPVHCVCMCMCYMVCVCMYVCN